MSGERVGVGLPGNDLPQDPHAGDAGDVRDDVVQLQIHLHQRLLHVLHVRRRVLDQPLAMPQVGTERDDLGSEPEAGAEQPVRVELLNPLRVVDVRLAARDVFRVARVDDHDLEPSRFEDLEQRDPVDPGRLHRDRRYSETDEPVGQRGQICGEAPERAHGLGIKLRRHGNDVKRRPDVDAGRATVERRQRRHLLRALLSLACHDRLRDRRLGSRSAHRITFLNGIARGRHQSQVRCAPWTMFFNGDEPPKSRRPLLPSRRPRSAARASRPTGWAPHHDCFLVSRAPSLAA